MHVLARGIGRVFRMRRAPVAALAAVVLSASVFSFTPASADLLILPIRVVFKDKDRMQSVTVMNTSEAAATFRLSFYHQRQVMAGGYEEIDGPLDPEHDLSKLIVFSPRQMTLPPGASQAVRLSIRRASELPDGEYRVHLKMQRLNSDDAADQDSARRQPKEGLTTRMTINIGFSIPVILRKGKYNADAMIAEPKFVPAMAGSDKPPRLEFFLDRTGDYSTLGSAIVYWTPPDGGSERKVGVLNDVNVYAETPRRKVDIVLTERNITGGTFRIVYEGRDADKGITFDEKTFPVQI